MRALHDAGGVSIWRLWRGLELIVGVVSLYKLALDEVGAVDGRRFRAATDSLLESERLSDERSSDRFSKRSIERSNEQSSDRSSDRASDRAGDVSHRNFGMILA